MVDLNLPSPDEVPASSDPGDDTARRYRYQWTYAAIVCCMLLDDTQDASEVFCEHHEDVLIKHADQTFSGLQVKTRESNQPVWKSGDAEVRSTCSRFAKLEAEFPGRFRAFRFLTNHPLYSAKSGQDFGRVLGIIRSASSSRVLPKNVADFVGRIAREANCSNEVAFRALYKTDATDVLPKFADIEARLVDAIAGVWARAADCSHTSVIRVARNLIFECGRASSLAHENVLPAYISATADPIAARLAARLAGKRISQSRMLEFLDRGLDETATLDGNPESLIEPGTGVRDLLLKKLDAGGFSVVTCNSALDLRDKADYIGVTWVKKHGRSLGLQRYSHVLSLVLSDAASAFEAAKNEQHPFGADMLSALRYRFQQRRGDGSQLYGCSSEHLEGFAYSLTAQCQVQWSLDRPWEVE